jgi:hypothetical protein
LPKSGQTREGLKAEGLEDLGETGKKKPAGNHDKHHGKSHGDKPKGDRPRGDKSRNDRPRNDRPRTDKPKSDTPKSDAPKPDAAALKAEGARQRRRTRSGTPATPAAE